jgi:hypothetical protein
MATTNPTTLLNSEISALGGLRGQLQGLQDQFQAGVGNQDARLRRELGANTASALAQQNRAPVRNMAGQLDATTRHMRARQGIVNRGDAAVRNQSLRDRVAVARGGFQRRGQFQTALQNAANIKEGVNVGVSSANQAIAESNADLFGGIAGVATGFLSDPQNRQKTGSFFRNMFFNPNKGLVAQGVDVNVPSQPATMVG